MTGVVGVDAASFSSAISEKLTDMSIERRPEYFRQIAVCYPQAVGADRKSMLIIGPLDDRHRRARRSNLVQKCAEIRTLRFDGRDHHVSRLVERRFRAVPELEQRMAPGGFQSHFGHL